EMRTKETASLRAARRQPRYLESTDLKTGSFAPPPRGGFANFYVTLIDIRSRLRRLKESVLTDNKPPAASLSRDVGWRYRDTNHELAALARPLAEHLYRRAIQTHEVPRQREADAQPRIACGRSI